MDYYRVSGKQGTQFFDGEFSPYPDLIDLILGKKPPVQPRVKVVRGARQGDMMFAAFNVVSRRFIQVLEECEATGFRACPIEVVHHGCLIPDYFLMQISGRGGPLDEHRSGVRPLACGAGIMAYDAIYMDETKWDGNDVFSIPGMGIMTFVVERVAQAIRRAKLLNVRLVKNSEYGFP